MSTDITCTRCGQTRARMAFKPFQNDLGQQLFDSICGVCWGEWLKRQQQLINHYGLNLREPAAKELLMTSLKEFLLQQA